MWCTSPETNNFHVAHLKFASNQNIQNISSSILRLDSHKWNQKRNELSLLLIIITGHYCPFYSKMFPIYLFFNVLWIYSVSLPSYVNLYFQSNSWERGSSVHFHIRAKASIQGQRDRSSDTRGQYCSTDSRADANLTFISQRNSWL